MKVHPYGRKTILSVASSLAEIKRKMMSSQDFSSSPQDIRLVREKSSNWVMDVM